MTNTKRNYPLRDTEDKLGRVRYQKRIQEEKDTLRRMKEELTRLKDDEDEDRSTER